MAGLLLILYLYVDSFSYTKFNKGDKYMRKRKLLCGILVMTCAAAMLAGCGSSTSTETDKSDNTKTETKASDHEPITINAPYRNINEFISMVHEKYPEINIEVVPYSGNNTTNWMGDMLKSGELTDIYFTTIYSASNDKVSDKLMDLAGYDVTDKYVQSKLREVTVDGAVYMLPMSYNCYGITYNKTLLEKNGWELPTSLEELRELAPKAEEAGVNLALDMTQYPGFGFQYLCNILDTGFLSTIDGMKWQRDFLAGTAGIKDSPEMMENLEILDQWREIGLLNDMNDPQNDNATKDVMREGNTLFLLGNTTDLIQNETDKDTYKMMPYLSEDGKQNVFIFNVNRYVGLNKNLEEKGNEQKLEDAMHVLEVLSTEDGMWSMNSNQKDSAILSLKEFNLSEDSYYGDVLDELNNGQTAPFIYSGWENVVVPWGEKMIEYIRGTIDLDELIDYMDETQVLITDNEAETYTKVTETLDTEDCAKLIGICFAQAADADAALISENVYYYDQDAGTMNEKGVSGSLFPLPVTEQELVSILPTGWNGNIETVTLTGARIKELAETGYEKDTLGHTYPYVLMTKEGNELKDDTEYTVAICGATDEVQEEGKIQDSGILGLDAAKEYFNQFETLSKKDIVWK